MSAISRWVPLALLLSLPGCIVRTFHPAFTPSDTVYEPALIGEWVREDGEGEAGIHRWVFAKGEEDRSYAVLCEDESGKQGRFVGHLAELQGKRFIDLFPAEPDLAQNGFYQVHLVPVHSALWVQGTDPKLKLSVLDTDWIKQLLKATPGAIAHAV